MRRPPSCRRNRCRPELALSFLSYEVVEQLSLPPPARHAVRRRRRLFEWRAGAMRERYDAHDAAACLPDRLRLRCRLIILTSRAAAYARASENMRAGAWRCQRAMLAFCHVTPSNVCLARYEDVTPDCSMPVARGHVVDTRRVLAGGAPRPPHAGAIERSTPLQQAPVAHAMLEAILPMRFMASFAASTCCF